MNTMEPSVNIDKDLYPFRNNFAEVNGFPYHYVDEGDKDADPVIMVHGNPTWSFYYRNLIKDLSPRYRTIAPDHVGCGLSGKPGLGQYNFTLVERVDDLDRFIRGLDLQKKITLVVHDWGGMIGLSWARQYADRIGRLVILNTSGFHMPSRKKLPLSLKVGRNTKLGENLILRFNAFGKAANHLCVKRTKLPKKVQKTYLAPYPNRADRWSILRFVQDIPLTPADPSYHTVTMTQKALKLFKDTPTLILWGAKDFVFDETFLDEWREHMPHARIRNFRDAGHYILEDAYPECLAEIKNFLENNPIHH